MILLLLVFAIATESLAELFQRSFWTRWIRQKISNRIISEFLECKYCQSFWIAFIISYLTYKYNILIYVWIVIAIHRMANYLHNLNDMIISIKDKNKINMMR